MALEDLMNYVFEEQNLLLPFGKLFLVLVLVVTQEEHVDLVLEDLVVLCLIDVLCYRSEEPPASISAVVARPPSFVQQVGDQPVPHS